MSLVWLGALEQNIVNADSTTGANQKVHSKLENLISDNNQARRNNFPIRVKAVLFVFGTVDTQVNLFYKLCHNPEMDVDAFLKEICEEYSEFIKSIKSKIEKELKAECVVCSAFLPVVDAEHIRDSLKKYMTAPEEPERSRVARLLAKLLTDRPQLKALCWREERVRQFNRLLAAACDQIGVTFLDINRELLDSHGIYQF